MSRPRVAARLLASGRAALTAGSLAALVAACASGPPAVAEVPADVGPVSEDPEVAVVDDRFEPADVVVEAGTTVHWTWEGRAAHDVVGDGFESEVQAAGMFTHAFGEPGAYAYVCTLHPGMEATVYVVPPTATD